MNYREQYPLENSLSTLAEWVSEHKRQDIQLPLYVYQERMDGHSWGTDKDGMHLLYLQGWLEVVAHKIARYKTDPQTIQYEYRFEEVEMENRNWFVKDMSFLHSLNNAREYQRYRDDRQRRRKRHNSNMGKDKWEVFSYQSVHRYYYLSWERRESVFEEFPFIGLMHAIRFGQKRESHHKSLANYLSWQIYLFFKEFSSPHGGGEPKIILDQDISEIETMKRKKQSVFDKIQEVQKLPKWYSEKKRSLDQSIDNTKGRLETLKETPEVFDPTKDIPMVVIESENSFKIYLPVTQLIDWLDYYFHIQSDSGEQIIGEIEELSVDENYETLKYTLPEKYRFKENAVAAIDSQPCEDGTYVIVVSGIEMVSGTLSTDKKLISLTSEELSNAKPIVPRRKAAATTEEPSISLSFQNEDIMQGELWIDTESNSLYGIFILVDPKKTLFLILPDNYFPVSEKEDGAITFKDYPLENLIHLEEIDYVVK